MSLRIEAVGWWTSPRRLAAPPSRVGIFVAPIRASTSSARAGEDIWFEASGCAIIKRK
jgi:hypothetical protein